jgi:iron complex outermembrane receptor protein
MSVLLLAALFVPPALAADEASRFHDIPAGPAADAFRTFSEISGKEILFAAETVRNVRTRAIKGEYAAREAIDLMLAGTGLVAVQDKAIGGFAIQRTSSPAPGKTSAGEPRANPDTEARQPPGTVNEIVRMDALNVTVSVQKRPQSSQDVPIAMTALPARTLDRFKIEDVRDLSRITPNFLVSSFSQSNPTLAIRGATNTFSQIGVSKPVVVVIDDVFIPRNTAASFELFDLDSAQVLRGPQGTLFGRNVTGGAIIFNTRLPSFSSTEIEALAEYGNFNGMKLQGMVSGPITKNIAGKIVVSRHEHDGYGQDRLTGREQDDQASTGVRGQLRFKLSPETRLALGLDYSTDNNGGRTLSSKGAGDDGDRRTSEIGLAQSYERIMWGFSSHFDWLPPAGNFTSITAWRESESEEDYSGTGVHYGYLPSGSQNFTDDYDRPKTFTEEIRYASPKWKFWDFVSGLYYLYEDGYRKLTTSAYAAGTGALATSQLADQGVTTTSYAAYWDATFHMMAGIDLMVGARYTIDRKKASLVRTDAITPANGFAAHGLKEKWSEFTPRVVLNWALTKDINAYGGITNGFTSGGFNTEASSMSALTKPFAPETVINYEAGIKSQWFGKKMQANIAVFYQKYNDKQELYYNTITRILTIVNASDATMKGVEIELSAKPVDGLGVSMSYGYLDATYDSFEVPGVLNYTGNPLGSAPKNKFSATVDYEYRIKNRGLLFATAVYSWTDEYYTGASKDPSLFINSYALVNASLGFETINRRWRLTFWARNLCDEEYLLTPSTQGVLAEYLAPPRTYGVTLGMRF